MDLSSLLAEVEATADIHAAAPTSSGDYYSYRSGKKYPLEALRRPQSVADIGRETSQLYHTFGLDVQRKKNLQLIENGKIIVYAAGNACVFENLETQVKQYLLGLDEGGVGCVAVHPSKRIFAVGGRGFQPKIYIYTYPDMKIVNVLTGGAERGFASLNFNVAGNKLASVAQAPDYMLTVWDWEDERIALHAKAFGQDVFDVKFSLDDDRRLVTSGTGHIRFWKMASTFTGLKLQGSIGKFGKIELSDIQAFVELPDGKVVSGTETGALLLWEGNFIKCRFVQEGGAPCHASEITYLELDRAEKCVMTASNDGFIRWWDFNEIDAAEVDSDVTMDFVLQIKAQYYLGDVFGVKTLIDGGVNLIDGSRSLVIVDKNGRVETLKFDLRSSGAELKKLVDVVAETGYADALLTVRGESHAGPITGLDTSPLELLAATCGADGTVRAWDIVARKQIACKSYGSAECTSLRWLPASIDSTCKHLLVGFADGVARLLVMGEDDDGKVTFARKMVFKPHNDAVVDAAFNPEGNLLATAGKDGNVFFFNCQENNGPGGSYTPLRFFVVNAASSQYGGRPTFATRLSWSDDGKSLLCSCSDQILREVDVSVLYERLTLDVESYEMAFPVVEFAARVQQLVVSESKFIVGPGSPNVNESKGAAASDEASGESKDGDAAAADATATTAPQQAVPSSPSSPSRKALQEEAEVPSVPLKVTMAIYSTGRREKGLFVGGTAGNRSNLYECAMGEEAPVGEFPLGVYSVEGKNAVKAPLPTVLRYTLSKRFLLVGAADGSVVARPTNTPEVFLRVSAHNGAVPFVSSTHDDRFLLSAGVDGTLSVHRLLLDVITKAAEALYKDLDAGVFNGALLKPPPAKTVPEPAYLTTVSSIDVALPDAPIEEGKESLPPVMPHIAPGDENLELPAGAYSIQDAKLKSEEDAKLITADALKEKTRLVIQALRQDYQQVVASNLALPVEVRLTPQRMAIDGEFFEEIRHKGDDMVAEVHKEFAYEAEKAAKLREKIERRLLPDLFVEEITLRALSMTGKSRSLVKSIRTQGVPPKIRDICTEIRAKLKGEEIEADRLRTEVKHTSATGAVTSLDDMVVEDSPANPHGGETSKVHDSMKASGSGPAARREARRQRKLKLREHLKEKPSENDDDARDLAAITLAENTLGDCKLKSSDDYVVPAGTRINVERKQEQMALLEDSMVKLRQDFNERFLQLRDLKCDIILSIRSSNKRIREIDLELSPSTEDVPALALWEPSLDLTEFPDDRGEVTEEELAKYMSDREKAAWHKCPPVPHSSITNSKTRVLKSLVHSGEHITSMIDFKERSRVGLTDSSNDAATTDIVVPFSDTRTHLKDLPTDQVAVLPKSYELANNSILLLGFLGHDTKGKNLKHLHRAQMSVPSLRYAKQALQARMKIAPTSEETRRQQSERRRVLEFERASLLTKISDNVAALQEAVDDLRCERQQLTGDLKQAELKLLTYFQEYQQLITFEARDLALQQKQVKSQKEAADIRVQVGELTTKLDGKVDEMQHWVAKAAAVGEDFKAQVPDNHAFVEPLTKIFRRKIKRNQMGGGDEQDEQEDEGEEEEEEEEDDDAGDVCPIGCEPATFEAVQQLRERRLDVEDMTTDVQKGIDECKKALDRLKQREKQVIKDVQQVEVEIRQFQKQKLNALNQIEIVVPLSLSQIYAFTPSGVLTGPEDKAQIAAALSGPTPEMSEADAEYLANAAALRDASSRQLITDMSPKTHVIINTGMILQLNDRIGALKVDTENARSDFAELKKERVSLSRERDELKVKIEASKGSCRDLQLLKLGRVIDLDDLEAQSDRSKEQEAERLLEVQVEIFSKMISRLEKDGEDLQERLAQTMSENTSLLNKVADLTEQKLLISRELNAPGNKVSSESAEASSAEQAEDARVKAYVQLQAREIEALRTELSMLKRKTAAPLVLAAPPPSNQQYAQGESLLPPIPNKRR